MPGLDENLQTWNDQASWEGDGENWSGPWGSSEAQWWGTLFPRIHSYLPADTILELGPGHGKWSRFLKDQCHELILVDLAANCISACRHRFESFKNIQYFVNDGRSLHEIADSSIDFVFSFDSLVHAEIDVMASYATELARVLRPDGVAFIHHSNMLSLRKSTCVARVFPDQLRRRLTTSGLIVNLYAWRASSVDASTFARVCTNTGLACIAQERVAWEYGRFLTDVISLITPAGSRWNNPFASIDNPDFMAEARTVSKTADLYTRRTTTS